MLFLLSYKTKWQHYQHRAKGHYFVNTPGILSIL